MNSQILLAAEQLGIFRILADAPRRIEDVATAAELPVNSAERLITALCALELVERLPDGRLANGQDAAEKLVPGRPGYVGGLFGHIRNELYPLWRHLGEALREEAPQWTRAFGHAPAPNETMFADSARLRAFMGGMHAITYASARELAARAPELDTVRRIVDLGGASGAFLIALAESLPRLHGTIVDLPAVQPVAEEYLGGSRVGDRLQFHASDLFTDPIPDGADAYALGFVLHDWDDVGGSLILDKVAQASVRGGLLIIGEFLLDDARTGPLFVARQDLNMLVAARGRERTAGEYAAWIRQHGFGLNRIVPCCNGKAFLLARKS